MIDLDENLKISSLREKELLFFLNENNLSIKNLSLLNRAFTHSSYANESKDSVLDNECLEFLGDSVLSLAVSTYIYSNFEGNEGTYTKIRANAVCEKALAEVALSLHLDKYLLIGKGEELTGGRKKDAILADCMEALIAVIYLECGFECVSSFIVNLLKDKYFTVNYDYKTVLQQFCQKNYKNVPVYTLVKEEGPKHNAVFYVKVKIKNKEYGPQSGKSKHLAEQNAAALACSNLGLI